MLLQRTNDAGLEKPGNGGGGDFRVPTKREIGDFRRTDETGRRIFGWRTDEKGIDKDLGEGGW